MIANPHTEDILGHSGWSLAHTISTVWMGEVCCAWSSLQLRSPLFYKGRSGLYIVWIQNALLSLRMHWARHKCSTYEDAYGAESRKMLRYSWLLGPDCKEAIAILHLTNLMYLWIAINPWWFCSLQSIAHSHTKWKYSLGGLQFCIFTSLNYSSFNQDCIIQVRKKMILEPVSWLLGPGHELVSQLCSCCQSPSSLRILNCWVRLQGAHKHRLHSSWAVCSWYEPPHHAVTHGPQKSLFCSKEVGVYLLPSCLFTKASRKAKSAPQ